MTTRTIPAGTLAWLEGEIADWQSEGLVGPDTAAAIRGRYLAPKRFSLVRIVLTLGGVFVGAGLIWLVASNLDELAPLSRFLLMLAVWLGFTALAEVLKTRSERDRDLGAPLVGLAQLLAAASFGAVVFQAAQSLQVPAYEPFLLAAWGVGSLVYAYAVRARLPLVLGVGLTTAWFVWQCGERGQDRLSVAGAFLVAGVVGTCVAALHARAGRADFAGPWRVMAAATVLLGLFVAALPFSQTRQTSLPLPLLVALVVMAGLVVAALAVPHGHDRYDVGVALFALLTGVVLALWPGSESGRFLDSSLPRAVFAVLVYLAVASGYAVLAGLRDDPVVTMLATAGLVVFVTFQSFAVFAPILPGSILFLVVGGVLIGTGVLADRGRRRLLAEAREREAERLAPVGAPVPTPSNDPTTGPEAGR